MWWLPESVPIYLYTLPADMRKGHNGLFLLAEQHMKKNPLQGGLFLFFSRTRQHVKILFWDRDGLALFHKRLEKGRFTLPSIDAASDDASAALNASQLYYLLDGVDPRSIRRLKRYHLPKAA